MLRFYLRLSFSRVEKFINSLKNYREFHHNFIKSAIYKKKIRKVLEINRDKLSEKLDIIDTTNQSPTSKAINFVR